MVIKAETDIDIDFQDRDKALEGLIYTQAALISDDGVVRPHTVGVYFQDIPKDPITGLANIDISEAVERGYFKIDMLNVSLYDGVKNEEHLLKLMDCEPIWEMLDDEFFIKQLWQIHNHVDLTIDMKPRTVDELSMLLGVIRPAKKHLQRKDWDEVALTIWDKPGLGDDGYEYRGSFFKRPHSVSYSLGIVVQMNLIVEELNA